jgi:hypothetical protein
LLNDDDGRGKVTGKAGQHRANGGNAARGGGHGDHVELRSGEALGGFGFVEIALLRLR